MGHRKFHPHNTNVYCVYDAVWTTSVYAFCCGMCGSQLFARVKSWQITL